MRLATENEHTAESARYLTDVFASVVSRYLERNGAMANVVSKLRSVRYEFEAVRRRLESATLQTGRLDQQLDVARRQLARDRHELLPLLVPALKKLLAHEEAFAALGNVPTASADQRLRNIDDALQEDIAPALIKLLHIELGKAHLRDMEQQDKRKLEERESRKQTGLYVEAARMVNELAERHDVGAGDFATLSPDDVAAIATIVRRSAADFRKNHPLPDALDVIAARPRERHQKGQLNRLYARFDTNHHHMARLANKIDQLINDPLRQESRACVRITIRIEAAVGDTNTFKLETVEALNKAKAELLLQGKDWALDAG